MKQWAVLTLRAGTALAVALVGAFMLGRIGIGGSLLSLSWLAVALGGTTLAAWAVFLTTRQISDVRHIGVVTTDKFQAVREAALSAIADIIPGKVYRRIQRPDGSIEFPFYFGAAQRALGIGSEGGTTNVVEVESIIHPDDRDAKRQALEASARDLTAYEMEYRVCYPSGDVQWVWSKGLPNRLSDGSTAWDCVSIDITDLKNAESALREREELISGITDRMPGYIYRRVRYVNGIHNTLYMGGGLMDIAQQEQGEGDPDILRDVAPIHPEDKDARFDAMEESAKHQTPFNAEFRRVRSHDGAVRWVRSWHRFAGWTMATPSGTASPSTSPN
jgi:PAS domain-containing protein